MHLQTDTLDRLAADLGLDRASSEFSYVWEHIQAVGAFTEAEVAGDNYPEALRTGRAALRLARKFAATNPTVHRRRSRGVSTWRDCAAAFEKRAADIARLDATFRHFVVTFSTVVSSAQTAQKSKLGFGNTDSTSVPCRISLDRWLPPSGGRQTMRWRSC